MLLIQEIFHKFDEELFLKNLFHVDLHYQIIPITKKTKKNKISLHLFFDFLLVKQIFDQYIFLLYWVENQLFPKNVKKTHKLFVYVAMMLLMLVLHLQHLFHLIYYRDQLVIIYEKDLLISKL
jgi:hypothetical protein